MARSWQCWRLFKFRTVYIAINILDNARGSGIKRVSAVAAVTTVINLASGREYISDLSPATK